MLDEPEELAKKAEASRDRLMADSAALGTEDGANPFVLPEEQWKRALERRQRLHLEELALRRGDQEPRTLKVQPTSRYHGQIQAFLAEVRGRLSARRRGADLGGQFGRTRTAGGPLPRVRRSLPAGGIGAERHGRAPYGGSHGRERAGGGLAARSGGGRICDSRGQAGVLRHGRSVRDRCRHTSVRARVPRPRDFSATSASSSPAITWCTWTTASGNSRACRPSRPTGGAASSCACNTRTRRGCTFRSSAWTWCRAIARSKTPSRSSIGWAARPGRRAKRRVRKSLTDMADKLLELYAERKTDAGLRVSARHALAARIRGRL